MALRTRPKLNSLPRRPTGEDQPEAVAKSAVPASRLGKKQVAFFVDGDTKRQLDRLAFDEEKSLQQVMNEALNLLFQSRGMARVADQQD